MGANHPVFLGCMGLGRATAWLALLAVFLPVAGANPPRLGHSMPAESPQGSWVIRKVPVPYESVITSVVAPPDSSGRLMYAEKGGRIRVFDPSTGDVGMFLDLSERVATGPESGLCSLVFHPGYATNRQFFVFYVAAREAPLPPVSRLARFETDPQDPWRALPGSEFPIISQPNRGLYHFAGDTRFGPDGYLYVSLGDEGYEHMWENAGRWDRGFFSGVIRIDVDQRPGGLLPNVHPAVHPGTYLVPPDNPFIGRTNYVIGDTDLNVPMAVESLRTEFWAVGFRNPWRMSFRAGTADLYVNDVGVGQREEVNLAVRGGHHGWPWKEGTQAWPFSYPKNGLADPSFEYEHSEGRTAITGSCFVDDPKLPDLRDTYLFADWSGPVYAMRRLADGRHAPPELLGFQPAIATIAHDPVSGTVWLAGDGLFVLEKQSRTVSLPGNLTATGFFESVEDLRPRPELVSYEVNQPFWSDHAVKRRWFVLPQGDGLVRFDAVRAWSAPPGTAWVKHFDLPVSDVDPGRMRRIETRVLVKTVNSVYGVTYRWTDDETEAVLVPESGAEEDVVVETAGGTRRQRWRYPGWAECRTCHTDAGGPALSFNTAQLNRAGSGGTNQLTVLSDMGCFEGRPPIRPNLLRAHPPLEDESVSIEHRVRSYLEVNCVGCHQPGTGNRSPWSALAHAPLEKAGLVSMPAVHPSGTLYEVLATNLVEPGSPSASVLFRRVAEQGPLRMPPLGSSIVNTNAAVLMRSWIHGLTNRPSYPAWARAILPGANAGDALPEADFDGDGDPNLLEFSAGTNPADPGDRMRLAIERIPGGGLGARFLRRAHHEFVVQSAPALGGPWSPVDHPANRPRRMAADEEAVVPLPSGPEVFVRVSVTPP